MIDTTKSLTGVSYNGSAIPIEAPVDDYKRPADWLPIPSMDGTQDEIYILCAVENPSSEMYLSMAGQFIVDWGDGTIEEKNYSGRTRFSHVFNYEDFADSTYTTYNNTKQALVHITATRGNITTFVVNEYGTYYQYVSNDMQISGNVQSCIFNASAFNVSTRPYFEIFEWEGNSMTGLNLMFYEQANLAKVSINCANMPEIAFKNCYRLISYPKKYKNSVSFEGNVLIKKAPQIKFGVGANRAFANCFNLIQANYLNTSSVTSMDSMFSNCRSLRKIKLDASLVTNIGSIFSNANLKEIYLYNWNPLSTSFMSLDLAYNRGMYAVDLLTLINSVPSNPQGTRVITLNSKKISSTNVSNVYVKDSGELYTIILPTNDTAVDANKTYYTYNEDTDTYTQVTPDFSSDEFYFELVTATWNRYDICQSTDTGAITLAQHASDKGYTLSYS